MVRSRITYVSIITPGSMVNEWRFIWQQSAATGLYLVYNQTQDYDGIPIPNSTKSFALKYSYLFDVMN